MNMKIKDAYEYKAVKYKDGGKFIKLNDNVWIGLHGSCIFKEKEIVQTYIKQSKTENINKEYLDN